MPYYFQMHDNLINLRWTQTIQKTIFAQMTWSRGEWARVREAANSSFFLSLELQMPLSCWVAGHGRPLQTVLAGSRISTGLFVAPHSVETLSPSLCLLISQVTHGAPWKNKTKQKTKSREGIFFFFHKKDRRDKPLNLSQITSLDHGYSSSELRSSYVGVKDRTFSNSCFLVCWAEGSRQL